MTRGLRIALLMLAAGAAGFAPAPAQDWRADALASFDAVWTTINDTFPDPSFGGLDWPGVRAELRPKAEAASSADAARGVIRDMLGRLHRSHFVLLSSSAGTADSLPGSATVPIEVRAFATGVFVTRVAEGSPAAHAGARPGDAVIAIDGDTAAAWASAAEGPDDRAKQLDVWRRAYRALHGAPESVAELTLKAPGAPERVVRVKRADEPGQTVHLGNLPPLHVTIDTRDARTPSGRRAGVIAFNFWMTSINETLAAAVDRHRADAGLVFDLRGNPGGLALMMTGVAGHVLKTPDVLGFMQTRETHDQPLTFPANPRTVSTDGRRVTPFEGPVAVLVDELTASTSECFAGGLQSLGRARIFGRPSAGQALPAATRKLPNGDVLMYAIGDFVTSTGRRLEGTGVVPDDAQAFDPVALAAGHDPTLEAALKWMDTRRGP